MRALSNGSMFGVVDSMRNMASAMEEEFSAILAGVADDKP